MNTRMLRWLLCMSIILQSAIGLIDAALPSHAAYAATFYVSKSGSNTYSCSQAQTGTTAKLTIAAGISCLAAGDTLFLDGGIYEETIDSNNVQIPSGNSWSNPITIAAIPNKVVTLKPKGASEVINLAHSSISYVVFDGLILDAAEVTGPGFSLTNGANHIRFKNGAVKNSRDQGILLTDGAAHNEFLGLKIYNNGKGRLSHGIYVSTSNNLIERNEIYSNSGYGIHVYHSYGGADNNIVRFNTTMNNSTYDCCSAGILVGSGRNNVAYGNIAYENPQGIVVGYKNATSTHVFNNTIYNNSNVGIEVISSSSEAYIYNNIIYGNATALQDAGSRTVLEKNLTIDPKFVDPVAHDFSLRPDSPAIDAGTFVNTEMVDFKGISRPQGKAFDIGANEFIPSSNITQEKPASPTNLRVTGSN